MFGEYRARGSAGPAPAAVPEPPALQHERARAGQFADGGGGPGRGLRGVGGRRGELAGQPQGLGEPVPYARQFGRAAAGGGGRQMPGGGQVHVVVEEFDDGDRAADARAAPRPCRRRVERLPGVEHGALDGLPVELVAAGARPGRLGGVDEQQLGAGRWPAPGLRSTQRWSGMPYGGAAPAGSATTARRAPRRSSSARIRRPERRDAAAGRHQQDGGAAGAQPGQRVLDPGQFGLGAGREAVLPARVVGEFVVAPVALVERRVAEHGVGGELAGRRRRAGCRRPTRPRTSASVCRASRSAVSAARSGSASCAYSAAGRPTARSRAPGAGRRGRARCRAGRRRGRPSARRARAE